MAADKPGLSNRQNRVIPAKVGIQRIKYPPRKRDNIAVLSASRGVSPHWIPAFAGMTGYWIIWDKPRLFIGKLVHVGAPPPARMRPQIAARAPLPQRGLALMDYLG
jgi:hypothetical protein